MTRKSFLVIEVLCALMPLTAGAQSSTDMAVLKGLAPVTVLFNTPEGIATLAANYAVTGGIQTGAIRQSTLLPFAEQQQQALRDAFITSGNLAQLADGLGTTLGASYLARAHYVDQRAYPSRLPTSLPTRSRAPQRTQTPVNISSPTQQQTEKRPFQAKRRRS
jgi:hypothetical protein